MAAEPKPKTSLRSQAMWETHSTRFESALKSFGANSVASFSSLETAISGSTPRLRPATTRVETPSQPGCIIARFSETFHLGRCDLNNSTTRQVLIPPSLCILLERLGDSPRLPPRSPETSPTGNEPEDYPDSVAKFTALLEVCDQLDITDTQLARSRNNNQTDSRRCMLAPA